jgi:hypothetical protein
VLPGQPVSFTSLLLPGTYHLVNYQDLWDGGVPQAAVRARALIITSQWSGSCPPPASTTSVFTTEAGRHQALPRTDRMLIVGECRPATCFAQCTHH